MGDLEQLQLNLHSLKRVLANMQPSQDADILRLGVRRSEAIVDTLIEKRSSKLRKLKKAVGLIIGLMFVGAGVYTGDVDSQSVITLAVDYLSLML